MNEGIIINKSALKRGFTRADTEWAFLHPIANGILSEYENKYLHVGFDTKGNPIEIIYNRIEPAPRFDRTEVPLCMMSE
jgi:hypothetical protein